MKQPQAGQSIREPLAPAVLYRAGVPQQEVLWFNGLPMPEKMRALRTPRGASILNRVREFVNGMGNSANTAQATPAAC